MSSFVKKKLQRLVVLRGAFVPWKVAPYIRSKRVQAGLITRSLLFPALICITSFFFVDTDLLVGKDADAILQSLPETQAANLFLIFISISIVVGTLALSLITHIVGKLIEVPDLNMRKSIAISGWATLCSFVLSVPVSIFSGLIGSTSLTGIVQMICVYAFVAMGWRKACRANAAQMITLSVLVMVVSLLLFFLAN